MTTNKKLKPNRNNIETYLPIFRGFYGSHWEEPCFDGEAEYYGLPANFPFIDYFDFNAYYKDLSKQFCNEVEREMSDFIEQVEFQELRSPQYYNFKNDVINCIIRPNKKAIQKYILERVPEFKQYLIDHLKSRSGFISFESYDFTEWAADTKNFTKFDHKSFVLGFILQFIAEQEQLTDILDYVDNNGRGVSEYYTPEFTEKLKQEQAIKGCEFINRGSLDPDCEYTVEGTFEMINRIKTFVKDNYIKPDVIELTLKEFNEQEIIGQEAQDLIYIDSLIRSVMNDIEKHNLKLELI